MFMAFSVIDLDFSALFFFFFFFFLSYGFTSQSTTMVEMAS